MIYLYSPYIIYIIIGSVIVIEGVFNSVFLHAYITLSFISLLFLIVISFIQSFLIFLTSCNWHISKNCIVFLGFSLWWTFTVVWIRGSSTDLYQVSRTFTTLLFCLKETWNTFSILSEVLCWIFCMLLYSVQAFLILY